MAFSSAPVYRVLLRLKQNLRNFQHLMVIRWNAAFSPYVMTSSQIFSLPARPNSFNKYILSCLGYTAFTVLFCGWIANDLMERQRNMMSRGTLRLKIWKDFDSMIYATVCWGAIAKSEKNHPISINWSQTLSAGVWSKNMNASKALIF